MRTFKPDFTVIVFPVYVMIPLGASTTQFEISVVFSRLIPALSELTPESVSSIFESVYSLFSVIWFARAIKFALTS